MPNGLSEAIYLRTDNAMTKRKRPTMIEYGIVFVIVH
jgi:hypothetical protein